MLIPIFITEMVLHLNEDGELVEDDVPLSGVPQKKLAFEDSELPEIVDAEGKPCDLHTLAARGDAQAVEELLAAGYDIHGKDVDSATPLHHAAFKGHKEIVRLLTKSGADVNRKDKDGVTPLHHAAFNGHKECMR